MVSDTSSAFRSDILVIDEDPKTAQVLRRVVCASSPSRVQTVKDVLEALRLACRDRPGIILLDGALIGMDRITCLRLLKAHPSTCSAPIVVMAPRLRSAEMETAYRAGAHALVLKPLRRDRVADVVQAALVAGRPVMSLT